MKPLERHKISELLTRIDHGVDGELVSVTMNNPQNFTVELSVQDKNRAYDWINIAFEIEDVSDARLLEDEKLSWVDMSEGISMICEAEVCAIGIGDYKSIDALKSAPCYLIGQTLKYEERPFSSE